MALTIGNFEEGRTYIAKKLDWESPFGEVCIGNKIEFEVLSSPKVSNPDEYDPISLKERQEELDQFLNVKNVDTGFTHLLHPTTLEWAHEV